MERNNDLSKNLKAYQAACGKSLAEFSLDLGIPRSTLQSLLIDGNTTVDTLVRMANSLDVSLEELVFGDIPVKQVRDIRRVLHEIGWFMKLSAEKQELFRYHFGELLRLMEYER